tara:strand:- start:274 stop:498 length:225 start_codon:yes stop_codon:yes gene_type:complete
MTFIYFSRPSLNTRRIFIGIKISDIIYRIGFKPIINKNKSKLIRYFYKIKEPIEIIDSPDLSLINKEDLEYINI